MTPFDPVALVAMLRAFYPAPSGAALVRARGERPEYFAGGTIFGSKSDKLRLPDGREFDCIVAAGGPPEGRVWQCAYIDPSDPGTPDPFPLEPGALVPLDDQDVFVPGGDPTFESIVAAGLGELDGADAVLAAGAETVLAFDGAAALAGDFAATMDPAIAAHAAMRAALDDDNPADVLGAATSHDGVIEAGREDYVEPEPPPIPEPDPGDPPGDHTDTPPPDY